MQQQQIRYVASSEELRRLVKSEQVTLASDQKQFGALRKSLNVNSVFAAKSFSVRSPMRMIPEKQIKTKDGGTFTKPASLRSAGIDYSKGLTRSEKLASPKDLGLKGGKLNALGRIIETQEQRLRVLKNIAFLIKDFNDKDTISARIKKDVDTLIAQTVALLEQTRSTVNSMTKNIAPTMFRAACEILKEEITKKYNVKHITVSTEARHLEDSGILYVTYLNLNDVGNAKMISSVIIAVSAMVPYTPVKVRKGERPTQFKFRVMTDYMSPETLLKKGLGAEFASPKQLVDAVSHIIDESFADNVEGISPVGAHELFKIAKKGGADLLKITKKDGDIKKGGYAQFISKIKVDDNTRSLVVYLKPNVASDSKLHTMIRANMFTYFYEQLRLLSGTFSKANSVKATPPERKNQTWQMRFQFQPNRLASDTNTHDKIVNIMKTLGIRDKDVMRDFERFLYVDKKPEAKRVIDSETSRPTPGKTYRRFGSL